MRSPKLDWKNLLKQDDKLRQSENCNLFDRAQLLKKIYDQTTFVIDMETMGKSPKEFLSARLYGFSFPEVEKMLDMFPRKSQWKGDLKSLRDKVYQIELEKRKTKEKPTKKRKTRVVVHQADHDKVIQENKDLKAKVKYLQEQLDARNQTIAILNNQIVDKDRLITMLSKDDEPNQKPKKVKAKD